MTKILKHIDYSGLDLYVYDKIEDPECNGCSGGFTFVYEWLEKNDMVELFDMVIDELFSLGICCDCELARHGITWDAVK